MSDYRDIIESAEMIEALSSCQTAGDLDYNGTALEVESKDGKELFHVVVNEYGVQQVLFWGHDEPYRLDLKELETMLARARDVVRRVGPG